MKILSILHEGKAWEKHAALSATLQKAAKAAHEALPVRFRFPCTATLLLTTDAAVRRLNHDFRGKDSPTNVLSFPQFDPKALGRIKVTNKPLFLGDIAIAHAYTRKESRNNNKLFENHVVHLMIHGFLHLFGYDHMNEPEARQMEKREKQIMAHLGLPDPYIAFPQTSLNKRQ